MARAITPDEAAAIAFHTAKANRIASAGPLIGYLLGSLRAYNTRANFRHPFTGPMKSESGWFDGERIRLLGREVARGERARLLVHSFRAANYGVLGILFCTACSVAYGTTVMAVGEMRDPRLTDVTRELLAKGRQQRGESKTRTTGRLDPTGQGEKTASDLWKQHRGNIGAEAISKRDDGSLMATGEAFRYTDDEGLPEDSGMPMGDEQLSTQQPIQGTKGLRNRPQPNPYTSPSSSETPPWLAEDSSPTSSGSAWGRIRRDASSSSTTGGPNPNSSAWRRGPQREQQPAGEGSEDFTFSTPEQEREWAREEAQREFDDMVEKERKGGGDFGRTEGNGGRGW